MLFCFAALSAGNKKPLNIIFMIGDGMGFNHIQAALTVSGNKLFMSDFPYTGIQKTHSLNDYITDSPAGGTALACGVKTNNGIIGMSPDSVHLCSILLKAEEMKLSTGIVTTCNLTHPTPAAFYAHAGDRLMTEQIATWFPKSGIDIAIGGGINDFERRKDNRNISEELRKSGYQVLYSMDDAKQRKSGNLLVLLAEDHPKKVSEGRDYLPLAVDMAIKRLSLNKKGFFLMVEGSQIDWGGHQNDQNYVVSETIDFDKAVGRALEFAKKDGNTLVIVTADHETGGTSIQTGSFKDQNVTILFDTKGHSGAPVPVFSYGPGAENFSGWFENVAFKSKITDIMRW